MVNTRSKRGVLLSTGNTPKRAHKRPRRMPSLAAIGPGPVCPHADPFACTCGSSRPAFFVIPGKPRTTNPVSEQYLIANLDIDLRQLTLLIGASMAFKTAVKRIIMDHHAQPQAQAGFTQWRLIDGTGEVIAWTPLAAALLDEITAEHEENPDENPDENPAEGIAAGEWQDGPMEDLWDLKTLCGRGWMCFAFIPALMDILRSSSIPGATAVYEKVMRVDNTEGVRAHLLYCAVKIGVGVVSARRQEEWEKVLEKRERQRMVCRLEALEKGGVVVPRLEPELLEKQIESATAAKIAVLRTELYAKIKTATTSETEASNAAVLTTIRAEIQTDFQAERAANLEDFQNLRTEIEVARAANSENVQTLRTEFRTEIEATNASNATNTQLIVTLAHDLKGTRDLLSADQIESRRWMQDAVTKIEASWAGKPAPGPAVSVDLKQAAPLLFLRIRTSDLLVRQPLDENIEDRFFRSYVAGESTFAVARGLLLQFATPFFISVMGYSGAGKSHTILSEDGIIAVILGRLRNPIHIHVYEILAQSRSIADFTYPDSTIQSILDGISKARATAKTPANETSSRAHILIVFENDAGEPYGILVDVAGAEESENRAELDADMKRTSAMIAIENGHIRSLLVELAAKGKAGFTSKTHVSEVKRASALNMEVARFLRRIKGEPAVRVMLCVDGARMDLMDRALTLIPEF